MTIVYYSFAQNLILTSAPFLLKYFTSQISRNDVIKTWIRQEYSAKISLIRLPLNSSRQNIIEQFLSEEMLRSIVSIALIAIEKSDEDE